MYKLVKIVEFLKLSIKNLMHYICLKNSKQLDNLDYQTCE